MTSIENRTGKRVRFERGLAASLMAIDGTWRRECMVIDIADDGAKIAVTNVGGLNISEFFLLLSSVGVAYRRCNLAWINGGLIGVSFIRHGRRKKVDRKSRDNQLVS